MNLGVEDDQGTGPIAVGAALQLPIRGASVYSEYKELMVRSGM
jgi:hypothetical protein